MSRPDKAERIPEDPSPDRQSISLGEHTVIKVFVQVEAGSRARQLYDEKTLAFVGVRQMSLPYPYPYGFILGTSGEDGDNVDCYVITQDRLKAGSIFECMPIGLLEQKEGDEIDHKILAALPGQDVDLNQQLLEELRAFITALNAPFPDLTFDIGRIRPREAALNYIRRYQEKHS